MFAIEYQRLLQRDFTFFGELIVIVVLLLLQVYVVIFCQKLSCWVGWMPEVSFCVALVFQQLTIFSYMHKLMRYTLYWKPMLKSIEYAKFRTAAAPKPVDQFGCRFKYITISLPSKLMSKL